MKNDKTIDGVIEEKRSKAHTINWIAPVIQAIIYSSIFGCGYWTDYKNPPNVPASIEEGKIQSSLSVLKRNKEFYGERADFYKIPVLDDFVNAYIDGNGTIPCKDRTDNSQYYNLTYDGDGGFVINLAPKEAKGSHYMGSSIILNTPKNNNSNMKEK